MTQSVEPVAINPKCRLGMAGQGICSVLAGHHPKKNDGNDVSKAMLNHPVMD
jgi:hypothetical protein